MLQVSGASAVTLSDPSFYHPYPYVIIIDDDAPLPTLTDEQFFDAAASVTFPVGVSRLPKEAPLVSELRSTVIPRINGDSLQLVRLIMRGAASPEGTVALNRRLGQERLQALLDFFEENMRFPLADDILSVDTDIEDYRSLCLLMERAGDPDYAFVRDLCRRFLDADLPLLKQSLMTAQGGRLWQRLLRTYFPQLRTARFVIVLRKYTPKPETVTVFPEASEVPVAPEAPEVPAAPELPELPAATAAPAFTDSILHRRELLSLKTNLLFYGAYIPGYDRWCPIPNVSVEYYPKRGHFTYAFSFDMPWWQDYDAHKFFQFRNYQLETRCYLRSSSPRRSPAATVPGGFAAGAASASSPSSYHAPAFSGFFLSAYAHAGLYGICFDADRGWVGEGWGAGIGLGYVTPISRNGHWRLEFALQAGFFRTKYDPYKYENPIDPDYHDDLYYYKWTLTPDLFKKRQYRWNWIGPTRIGITISYDLLYRRIQKRGASFKNKELLNFGN